MAGSGSAAFERMRTGNAPPPPSPAASRSASFRIARQPPQPSDALGLACGPRSRVTVLDIDTADENILADTLDRHGRTPFIVRSESGNYQAWYRHNGERRRTGRARPWPGLPIDLLGSGYVVAPPSRASRGQYEIIEGGLDDLDRLPVARGLESFRAVRAIAAAKQGAAVPVGCRNDSLWRHCMKQAHHCDAFDDLIDVARTFNEAECTEPLGDAEVIRAARSAWEITERGQNRVGQTGAWFPTEEAVRLITSSPDMFLLLAFLRANNGPDSRFIVCNGLADRFRWPRKRLSAARSALMASRYIKQLRGPGRSVGPAIYRWVRKGGQN
jgi:hypothetical protein